MALYGITEYADTEASQLVAGSVNIQRVITLKADCGDLARGTVLEMVSAASGTWQQLQAGSPANARAILAENVSDGTSTQRAQAYTLGLFRAEDVIWPDGITATNQKTALQTLEDRGLSIDEAWLDAVATTTTTTTTTTTAP